MNTIDKSWIEAGKVDDIPLRGARIVRAAWGDIAVFRTGDGSVFALEDRCPHRQGPLSQGIVHGRSVTCPLHNWVISLETGRVEGPDDGCARAIAVRIDDGRILLNQRDVVAR